jgi:pimeloyl-ACP methyl ester carboxylesterase
MILIVYALCNRIGVSVLKSESLRMLANYLSYKDRDRFATKEAMLIGRLHCKLDEWERGAVDFTHSGGFILSDKISQVQQEVLVLWGRQDTILDVKTPYKFQDTLPCSRLVWVEECGHVPHLEQPAFTAATILDFLKE